jgi:pimeloyl-ACP methyl ester carboxylesterase
MRSLGPLWAGAVAIVLAALALASASAAAASAAGASRIRIWTIHYRAQDGAARAAYVVLPAWYGPHNDPPIPLVISPHGRGVTGRANVVAWGALPARGPFAIVSPDGEGRRLPLESWGAPGQIEDLARMPQIIRATLPWLRIQRGRIYAVGGSMGGQEALLLLARHPRLLAGVAAFDAVTDLTRQYRNFPRLACNDSCLRKWAEPLGQGLRKMTQLEIGGTPELLPREYAERSPLTYAHRIAASCVPARALVEPSRPDRPRPALAVGPALPADQAAEPARAG